MKLTFLEDGVLDYKGEQGRTYAVPNAIPVGSLKGNQDIPPASSKHPQKFRHHLQNCPQCSKKNLCSVGKLILSNLED